MGKQETHLMAFVPSIHLNILTLKFLLQLLRKKAMLEVETILQMDITMQNEGR